MNNLKGLTLKDYYFINSQCRSIAKFDRHGVSDYELRIQIYMLGLYAFRKFHKAGLPKDFSRPSISRSISQSNK